MAEPRHSSTRPDPAEVKLDGFPEPEIHRAIFWEWGHEQTGAGSLSDSTHLYIAEDTEGETCWWRQVIEDSVGNPGEAEQISFEEVLEATPPKYWPVAFYWTMEAIVEKAGWSEFEDKWAALLRTHPATQEQLKTMMVALMPKDTEETRLRRHLDPAAARYHDAPTTPRNDAADQS